MGDILLLLPRTAGLEIATFLFKLYHKGWFPLVTPLTFRWSHKKSSPPTHFLSVWFYSEPGQRFLSWHFCHPSFLVIEQETSQHFFCFLCCDHFFYLFSSSCLLPVFLLYHSHGFSTLLFVSLFFLFLLSSSSCSLSFLLCSYFCFCPLPFHLTFLVPVVGVFSRTSTGPTHAPGLSL